MLRGHQRSQGDVYCWCSWEPNTYGYHGDDGRKYSHPIGNSRSVNQGTEYGPTYTSGDTVGAGLNLETQEIFFTYAANTSQLSSMSLPKTACLLHVIMHLVMWTACHSEQQHATCYHSDHTSQHACQPSRISMHPFVMTDFVCCCQEER